MLNGEECTGNLPSHPRTAKKRAAVTTSEQGRMQERTRRRACTGDRSHTWSESRGPFPEQGQSPCDTGRKHGGIRN